METDPMYFERKIDFEDDLTTFDERHGVVVPLLAAPTLYYGDLTEDEEGFYRQLLALLDAEEERLGRPGWPEDEKEQEYRLRLKTARESVAAAMRERP
jgi:hypothetical protein